MSELKNLSIKKTQPQDKLDQTKAQYQNLLTEMQELQHKLSEWQKTLKQTSGDPKPEDLDSSMQVDPSRLQLKPLWPISG